MAQFSKNNELTVESFLGDDGICDRKILVTLKSTGKTHGVLVTGIRFSDPINITCAPQDPISSFSVDDIEHVVYNDNIPWYYED